MKVLIVVDMQNDFINGPLGSEQARMLVPRIVNKIRDFDGFVVMTHDTHDEKYLDTLEGKKLPVVHCIKFTDGWELHPDIEKALIRKRWDHWDRAYKNTFGYNSWNAVFGISDGVTGKPDEVEICGLCTEICVVSNALILRSRWPNVRIVVNEDLTEGVTPETKRAALKTMEMCQIDVEWKKA